MSATRGNGGGHSKGQTMPYAVVWAWDGGTPGRKPTWTLGAAEAALLESLRAANHRDSLLEAHVVDRATGETVITPQRCVVCGERWATEYGTARGADAPSLCAWCEDDEPAAPDTSAPVVAALRARGLEPVARPDGTVSVETNGIGWTLKSAPHAITGEPSGVWSVFNSAGTPRGQFMATKAAEFIAHRTTP